MSLHKFAERLEKLGCSTNVKKDTIEIDIEDKEISVSFEDEWKKSIRGFYRARQYQFDANRRVLSGNKFVEFQVIKLDPGFSFKPVHKFSDKKENQVVLCSASREYMLSFFESQLYEDAFDYIKRLIQRRFESRTKRLKSPSRRRLSFRVDDLFVNFNTATYLPKRKLPRDKLLAVGLSRIKSCLFNLAYTKNEAWEVRDEIKSKGFAYGRLIDEESELDIPSVDYDSNIVSYYKVAKSSIFPGQVFLSYYHILEYYFLRVADEDLFQTVRVQLNDPAFKATYENVTKLLAAIKRYDNTHDEKKMLRSVLMKFVPEEDYIAFINNFEVKSGVKIFTGGKQKIFGETFTIKLEKGHALSNSASLLKHIRNSLVHSSDRYTREDCYLPFSESEEIVAKYIPIIQFMAEKVIFSTAV